MATLNVPIAVSGDDGRVAKYGPAGIYPPTNAAGENFTDTSIYAIRGWDGTSYEVSSSLLRFDTSTLPSTAVLSSAYLRINIWEVQNGDTLSLTADYFTWTGTASTDFAQTAGTNAISGIALSTLSNGVTDLSLSSLSGISLTGSTYLRLHISNRASDAAPAGYNDVRFYAFDDTTFFSTRPRLIVNYTLPNTTRMAPDAIISQTNLTGVVAAIQDDPDAADASWLTAP